MEKVNLLLIFVVMAIVNFTFACFSNHGWVEAFHVSYFQATTLLCVFFTRKFIAK